MEGDKLVRLMEQQPKELKSEGQWSDLCGRKMIQELLVIKNKFKKGNEHCDLSV